LVLRFPDERRDASPSVKTEQPAEIIILPVIFMERHDTPQPDEPERKE
jgi:hypothetical protein